MIRSTLFILVISFLYSFNSFSLNISVINIEELIDTYDPYIKITNKIDKNQKKFTKILREKETELESLFQDIENSKILLDEIELNKMINNYNILLEKFNKEVENFNLHYQDQIIKIRKKVLKEIIVLAEKYAKNNSTDLILDSTNYLIASNAIDITSLIKKKLNETIIELEFESFDQN